MDGSKLSFLSRHVRTSMIVHNLNLKSVGALPSEADMPLIVDVDTVFHQD